MKHILGILTFACALGVNAASDIDPNVAMGAINLDAEQKTQFNVMMRRLNRSISEAISKERRRNAGTMSARNIEKRIKRKIKRLYRDLDETAEDIVREDQWDAYLVFKDAHHIDTNKQEFVPAQNREN